MSELGGFILFLILIHASTWLAIFLGRFPQKRSPESRIGPWQIRLGKWEYSLGPFRDRVLSPILIVLICLAYFRGHHSLKRDLLYLALILVWLGSTRYASQKRRQARLRTLALTEQRANIHPEDFFNFYYASLSPWPTPQNYSGRNLPFAEADFRSGQAPKKTLSPVLPSAISTNTLAKLAIFAFHHWGSERGRDAFDYFARVWSSRLAFHFKMRLKTTGAEKIPPLEGKTLLLFNHNSYLDFVLNFFALGDIRYQNGRHLRPRFIAAKDHFIDNKIVYSWINLGKVIENAGMIFVNRREKGKGWQAMTEAAEKLVNTEVEIAVYPQGTRAAALRGLDGNWQDAGFYTSAPAKNWNQDLGHLKPGTAHLILDTLLALQSKGEKKLNVLTAGIRGVGEVAPKGSSKVVTEKTVEFNLASLWEIPVSLAQGIAKAEPGKALQENQKLYLQRIEEVQLQIQEKLLEALNWHAELIKELLERMSALSFQSAKIQAWVHQLKIWDAQKKFRPFIMLERIFCLEPESQKNYLRQLEAMNPLELEENAALFLEVSENFFGKKLN